MVMGYMLDNKDLLKIGIPIYSIILGFKMFQKIKRGKEIDYKKELVKFILAVYIFALVGVTLFPITIYFGEQSVPTYGAWVNYVPFRSIIQDMFDIGHGHFSTAFQIKLLIRNVGGNFILLMPLGMLLPIISRKINSIKKVLILGFAVSLSIELLQFLGSSLNIIFARVVDIDDIILNTLGAATGYIIYVFANSVFSKFMNRTAKYGSNV